MTAKVTATTLPDEPNGLMDYLRSEAHTGVHGGWLIMAANYIDALLQSFNAERLRAEQLQAENERLKEKLSRLPADWDVDSSLETWFPLTAGQLARAEAAEAEVNALAMICAKRADHIAQLLSNSEQAEADAAEALHEKGHMRERMLSMQAAKESAEARAEAMAKALHYPDCWDTAAYPTLADALAEVYATFKCTNDDTHPAIEQGAQHG